MADKEAGEIPKGLSMSLDVSHKGGEGQAWAAKTAEWQHGKQERCERTAQRKRARPRIAREAEEGVAVSTTFRNNNGRYRVTWHPPHETVEALLSTNTRVGCLVPGDEDPERRIDNVSETLIRIQDEMQLHSNLFALLHGEHCYDCIKDCMSFNKGQN